LREKHGYLTMTPELRQKVFAQNAAKHNLALDDVEKEGEARRGRGEEARLPVAQSDASDDQTADAARFCESHEFELRCGVAIATGVEVHARCASAAARANIKWTALVCCGFQPTWESE
jgi:hypothetical protein